MSHSHEIFHLSEIDRRNFLKMSSLATGIAISTNFFGIEDADAQVLTKLPGFTFFSDKYK